MSEATSNQRTSLPVLLPLGLHAKNQPIKLGRPVYVLGAKQQCRIHLVSSSVSNTHAVLVQTRHITYIRDLCSRTHVYVNGNEVKEAVLHDGDLLTIGRFQFKYQGPVKDHGAEPAVIPAVMNVVGSDTPVPLESRAIVIGRRPTCDVPLLEESVSTVHAILLQWEGHRFLRDLWSRTGTFVNGKAIHECEIKPGDHIKIGETEMTYAPSVDEVAFSLVEGASDSIYGDTPAAEEVDLGKEIQPKMTAAQAPLELILTPKSPPPPEEMLPLDADEALEPTPHDTAHIPLSIEVETTGSKTAKPSSASIGVELIPQTPEEEAALSSRGWRSSTPDENEKPIEIGAEAPAAQTVQPAATAEATREVIEPTQPTPESALGLPIVEEPMLQTSDASNELTDTTFGRNVEEFEGESLGPIVESAERENPPVVSSTPVHSMPPHPPVEEAIEPEITFPTESAENFAVIDSSAMPLEPLLEKSPSDAAPNLASLSEDALHPIPQDDSPIEVPLLSDSIIPQNDAEPAIDLSSWNQGTAEPAIDDTLSETSTAEAPLLPMKSPAIEIVSPGDTVVGDHAISDDSVPESAPANDDASIPLSSDSIAGQTVLLPSDSMAGQVVVAAGPFSNESHSPVPTQEIPSSPAAEIPVESDIKPPALPAENQRTPEIAPAAPEPLQLEEAVDSPLLLDDESTEALVPISPDDTAMNVVPLVETESPETVAPSSPDDAPTEPVSAEPVFEPSAVMDVATMPLAEETVELAKFPSTHEAVESLDESWALELIPETESPVESKVIEPVTEASATIDHSVIDETPVEAMTLAPSQSSEAPAIEVETPQEIPSSPTLESAMTNQEETSDHSAIDASPVHEFAPSPSDSSETSTINVETPEEIPSSPTLESAMANQEGPTEHSSIDASPVHEVAPSPSDSSETSAIEVETPEEIPSSPTLESAMANQADAADRPMIEVTPVQAITIPQSESSEASEIDVETPEEIPSSPTLESAMANVRDAMDLAKLSPVLEKPADVDAGMLIESPEEIPSAPTLESALASHEPAIDLAKLAPADPIGEKIEEPAAMEAIPKDSSSPAPVLETQTDIPFAPSPVLEAPPMSPEPADLSAMATKDQSTAESPIESTIPIDDSAALDFLTDTGSSVEGHATIDESSTEPPPAVTFPDIKPPAVLAEEAPPESAPPEPAPITIAPVEDPKLGAAPSIPMMDAPPIEPPADLGFAAIPIPRAGKRARRRPRVIRDGFRKEGDQRTPGHVEIPPFAEHAAGIAAGESLHGLSQAPARQADVFSDIPGAAAEVRSDIFSAAAASESEVDLFAKEVAKLSTQDTRPELPELPKRSPNIAPKPPRTLGRGVQPGFDLSAPRPVMPVDDPDVAIARRRKLLRRVPALMGVMVLLIAAAWAAVWFLVPMRTRIQATLVFRNFDHLTHREQHNTEADQANRLGQEVTRRTAIQMLQNRYPGIAPGFLDNPDQYGSIATNPETRWPDNAPGEFVIRYDGTDPNEDMPRVEAVALAMYDSNSQLANDARSLKATLTTLTTNIESAKTRIDELKTQQDQARAIIDAKPSKDQLDKLKADDADYNAEYNIAISKFKDAQVDLNRMIQQQLQLAAPSTAPADPMAGDSELQKMSKDADALAAQIESARKDRAAMAAKARETLDAAYDDFKKQIESSQGTIKDNPQLAAYVTAAQNTQQAIRDITDQYIQHQQDEYAELNGLKSKIMATMQQRRADQMANDPKLKDLNDQKEIDTRKYNTAVGQGLDKEASDLQKDIKLLDATIKAQQEIVSNDPVYNDMITGLQQLIDQKQHTIDAERSKTNEKLAELKSSFNKSAPAVEKMPAEQKELASAMQDRLSQLDAARRQYAEAANSAAADQDSSMKALNDQLLTIQTNIEIRKKQILAANADRKPSEEELKQNIATQTALVNQLDAARNTARQAYEQNQANLRKEIAASDAARTASEQLETANNQRDQLERQLEQNTREWDAKKAQQDSAIEPVEPTPDTVIALGDPVKERRNTIVSYGGFSSLAIFVVFAGWIMLTLLSAARESHESRPPAIEALETPSSGDVTADNSTEPEENEAAVA